ncbi:hypothetical protein [Dokdonella sp.]|uniref:hypothetical protein n=1 Tax=Dokdonella sp. TaxID=2291710 RepID=UPI002602AC90|nr:hypothetical protein [Dokdonella sp.]
MLKELNAIAQGLLGLEGYPTTPLWPGGASLRPGDEERDRSVRPCVEVLPAACLRTGTPVCPGG